MGKPKYKKCIFCEKTDSPPSDEHVFEKWIAALWPDGKESQFKIEGKIGNEPPDRIWGARGHFGFVVNRPCRRCNSGWMNNLGEKARDVLTKMIFGHPVLLTTSDQLNIARWAFKTTIMYEFFDGRSPRFYTPTNRRELFQVKLLPPPLMIWLGHYVGPYAHTSILTPHSLTFASGAAAGHANAFTFTIGQLALQTFDVRCPRYGGPVGLNIKGIWDRSTIEIWPVRGNRRWPPHEAFDDEALDLLAKRWYTLHH